jgi:hypothetical protein
MISERKKDKHKKKKNYSGTINRQGQQISGVGSGSFFQRL